MCQQTENNYAMIDVWKEEYDNNIARCIIMFLMFLAKYKEFNSIYIL